MNKVLLSAVMAGLLTSASAASAAGKEDCYGIAKAGQNSCQSASNACKGQAATDNDPNNFVEVEKGTCKGLGGKLTAPDDK